MCCAPVIPDLHGNINCNKTAINHLKCSISFKYLEQAKQSKFRTIRFSNNQSFICSKEIQYNLDNLIISRTLVYAQW